MPDIYKHLNHEELVSNLKIRENVLILGPTASGKTKGVQVAASELNLPIYIKVVGAQSTESSLMGYNNANGIYVEGIAYKPFTQGGILLIDEIDNGNANVNLTLNALADGKVAFPNGMQERHPDFCLVATANTIYGAKLEYCGRNRQDAALMNRFIFMKWDYDSNLEQQIALATYTAFGGDKPEIANTVIKEIFKFRQEIKKLKLNHIISPRTTIQAMKKLALGRTKLEIINSVIFKSLDIDNSKKILTNVTNSTLVEESIQEEFNELRRRYPESFHQQIKMIENECIKTPEEVLYQKPIGTNPFEEIVNYTKSKDAFKKGGLA